MGSYGNGSQSSDYGLLVAQGLIPGTVPFNKFGRNGAVGTSVTPITMSGLYQTPTAATAIEAVSTSAQDGVGGTGAREITVVGLNSSWQEVSVVVTMNGTTPVALSTNLIRAYRAYVSSSGTYGSSSAGSHAGTITIRTSGGGATWLTLSILNSFPLGKTLTGAYTVPAGYTLYLDEYTVSVESSKAATVMLFSRSNANDVTAPYSGAVLVQKTWEFTTGQIQESEPSFAKYEQYTDIGMMAYVASGTAAVSCNFSGYLVAN